MVIWELTFLSLLAGGILALFGLLFHGLIGSRNEAAIGTLWSVFFSAVVVNAIIYRWIIPRSFAGFLEATCRWTSVLLVLCSLVALSIMLFRGVSGKTAGTGILWGIFVVALGIGALIYFVVLG